jgi:hypothetical protein
MATRRLAFREINPQRFSQPEVQISLQNSFNQTVNTLSITIAPEEIWDIEAVAEPVRASVRQMFDRYRPDHGNGDQLIKDRAGDRAQ